MPNNKTILLPWNPMRETTVDEEFTGEARVARELALHVTLTDHDSLSSSEPSASFRKVSEEPQDAFYRGWMLQTDAYALMYAKAAERGVRLRTSPQQFGAAHYITGWIDLFEGYTPATVIVDPSASADEIKAAARELGSFSFIVKDFVKSRKHEWDTACFAKSLETLPAVVAEFIRLQEDSLVGGIVIREFVDLDFSRPELRVWWVDGRPVLTTVHPDYDSHSVPSDPSDKPLVFLSEITPLVQKLGNPFVTTDIARKADGSWTVVEVGDGQVSGFPKSVTDEEMSIVFRSI
jgi:hypothetical protein